MTNDWRPQVSWYFSRTQHWKEFCFETYGIDEIYWRTSCPDTLFRAEHNDQLKRAKRNAISVTFKDIVVIVYVISSVITFTDSTTVYKTDIL